MFNIKEIKNINQWENYSDIWIDFQDKCNLEHPFLDWIWIREWLKYLPNENILPTLIVVKNKCGKIVGLAPFQLRKSILSLELEAFAQEFCDYCDWLVLPEYEEKVGQEIVKWIKSKRKNWSKIRIENLVENGVAYRALKNYYPNYIEKRGVAPEIRMNGSIEMYLKGLNKKFLSDTRRRERKLSREVGNIHYVRVHENCEIPEAIECISKWLRRRRNERDEGSYLDRKHMRKHIVSLYRKLNENEMLHLTGFKIKSKYIALNVAFMYRKKIFSYTPVFDENYAKYGVMRLLKFKHITECFKNNVKVYDFCLGGEQYKYNFNPIVKQLYCVNMYGFNLSGESLKYIDKRIKPILKKSEKIKRTIKKLRHKAKIFVK